MKRLSSQLHAKNRIWLGETDYAWHLAQLIAAIGEDFQAYFDTDKSDGVFGSPYEATKANDEEKVDALLKRLRARLVR